METGLSAQDRKREFGVLTSPVDGVLCLGDQIGPGDFKFTGDASLAKATSRGGIL